MRRIHTKEIIRSTFVAAALLAAAGPAAGQDVDGAVDAVFADYDRDEAPGCALGVIRDGEFVYRRGYGMANLEYGIPLTSDSVFRIGSTSKQFTAAAVAMLARSGALNLDDPLRKHFPEFPAWAGAVTVRQLIHHTSGIRDYLQLAFLAGRGGDADHYTDDWAIELLARQRETNFPPGSRYLYSNSGYLLLAHLVERVSGQSLREYAEAYVFGPLGMKNTHFHDDHTEIVPRRAAGYAPREDGGYRISMTTLDIVGDGSVFTSIDELLAWDRNFYDNRLGGGQAFIEQLTTPGTLADGTATDYAFGLRVDTWRGLKRVSHGGAFVGYRADLQRFPDERLTVAVLCNRADADPSVLAGKVAAHYLADRIDAAPEDAAPEPLELPAEELARYAGDFWEAEEAFAAETQVIEGRLWAIHSPTRRNELVPVGPDRFRMVGIPVEVLVQFTVEDGRVVEMTRTIAGEPRGRFTPFRRREVTAETLAEYAGDYYSPELDVVYALSVEDGELRFELADEPPQVLTAMFVETFENPDYGAFTFERGAGSQITGFELQSGRVRNLTFEKR